MNKKNPNLVDTCYSLAGEYKKLGEYQKALKEYKDVGKKYKKIETKQ